MYTKLSIYIIKHRYKKIYWNNRLSFLKQNYLIFFLEIAENRNLIEKTNI